MTDPTPEEMAKQFARRWLREASVAMQERGEKEFAQLIRDAIEADRKQRGHNRAA